MIITVAVGGLPAYNGTSTAQTTTSARPHEFHLITFRLGNNAFYLRGTARVNGLILSFKARDYW